MTGWLFYLFHKITGYNTIKKIHTLQKYELIRWLPDIKLAGFAVIYPWLIARVKDPKSLQWWQLSFCIDRFTGTLLQ